MFVSENTACLSTFVKMSLYNSEENICSVYECAGLGLQCMIVVFPSYTNFFFFWSLICTVETE